VKFLAGFNRNHSLYRNPNSFTGNFIQHLRFAENPKFLGFPKTASNRPQTFNRVLLQIPPVFSADLTSSDMASSSKATAGRKTRAATANRDSIHVSRFNKKHSQEDFNAVCKLRSVLIERQFDEVLLGAADFKFLNDLKVWKWWKLVNLKQNVYVNAVRVFYFCGDNQTYDAQGNVKKGRGS